MSLNEEKMLVLKMLQEGKITSEEAAKLLEALEGGASQGPADINFTKQQKKANFADEVSKVRNRLNEWKKDFKSNYNQNDFDRSVEEFSTKVEKLGKNLAVTTFGIADKIADFVGSFVDTNAFNIFGNYKAEDRVFEAMAAEGMDLSIEAVNGHILLKKHLDSKVVIKTRVRSPLGTADQILVFGNDEKSISVGLNKSGNISVSHEVFLPAVIFNSIKLETTNSRICVEDSLSQSFEAKTRNSHMDLMGVNSNKISIATKNGRILVSYAVGKDIAIDTDNSIVDIKHVKTENLKASTKNGKILVENVHTYDGCSEVTLNLKTTNAGIKVNMNDMDNKGYKIKAQTTNGGINLLIPQIMYHNISKQLGGSFVEAESNGFENCMEKAYINAETTNGYIEIMK